MLLLTLSLLLILMPSSSKSQLIPRLHHTTTLLNSTAILTFGGTVDVSGSTFANTFVNSNIASRSSQTLNTTQSASQHSAVLWGNDGILILFGFANSPNKLSAKAVRLLNVTTGSLSSISTKNAPPGRHDQTATLVGGKVWVQGGQTLDTKALSSSATTVTSNIAVLNPSSMKWKRITLAANAVAFAQHSTVAVNNFLVSCFGINGTAAVQNTCSLFDTVNAIYVTPSYTSTIAPPPRIYSSMVMAPDGRSAIAFGGCNGAQFYNDLWSLNVSHLPKLAWTQHNFPASNLVPKARCGHTAVLVGASNRNPPVMMVLGGMSAAKTLLDNGSYYFDLRKMTWVSSIVVQSNFTISLGSDEHLLQAALTSPSSPSQSSSPLPSPRPASASAVLGMPSILLAIIIVAGLMTTVGLVLFVFGRCLRRPRSKLSKHDMPHHDSEDHHGGFIDHSSPIGKPLRVARFYRESKLWGKSPQDSQRRDRLSTAWSNVSETIHMNAISDSHHKRKDSLPTTMPTVMPPRKGSLPTPRLRDSAVQDTLPRTLEMGLPARPEHIHEECEEADLVFESSIFPMPTSSYTTSKRDRSVTSIQWYGFRSILNSRDEEGEDRPLGRNGLFVTNRAAFSAASSTRTSFVTSARSSRMSWISKAYAAMGGRRAEKGEEQKEKEEEEVGERMTSFKVDDAKESLEDDEDDEDMDSYPQHAAATKILTKLPVISNLRVLRLGSEVKINELPGKEP